MRGLTLTELLIAASIAFLVIAGIGVIDISRIRTEVELRQRSGLSSEEGRAALAGVQLQKHLEDADRLNLISGGSPASLQIRTPEMTTDVPPNCICTDVTSRLPPPPCCFDIAADYR